MMASSPPPLTSYKRTIPNLEDFLKTISKDHPVGSYLRYESVYDDVRLARQEDDPRLSMGIWQTDLKQADWGTIEALCVEALTTKTKDLQIAGWLAEAWISLDDLEGYIRGIQVFSGLVETFWDGVYPQAQEDGDMERRLMIFEWMDAIFSSRLLLVPLTQSRFEQTTFGLGFLKSAQHRTVAQKRAEKAKSSSRVDPSKDTGTPEDFQKSLDQTPDAYLSKCQKNIGEALQETQRLKGILAALLGAASPSFSQILATLKEMERILTTTLQARMPPPPPVQDPPLEDALEPSLEAAAPVAPADPFRGHLKTREDAYRQLEALAAFLEKNDPHSLAPQLLHQLIRWQNKNIMDIFEEIAKTPEERDILMKVLGRAS